MADLVRIFAIAAKTETVRLTDSVPTLALNAIRIVGPAVMPKPGFLETNERRDAQSGRLGSEGRAASAGRFATVSITCEVHGLGAAYGATPTVIDQDPLIRACGFARAAASIAPTDRVDYTDADLATTCTIYAWSFNKKHILTGCVGTYTDTFASGRIVSRTYEMTGVMAADPITEAPGAQTLTTVVGPVFTGAALSIGTFDVASGLQLIGGSFTLGNTITALPSAGASDGHNGYEIADRAPTLALNIFAPTLAAFNVFTKARSGSDAVSMAWGTPGSAGVPPYNGLSYTFAAWEPSTADPGDQGGVGVYAVSGPLKHFSATRSIVFGTR